MIDRGLALGLNRDTSPLNQVEGTYTYAHNIVTDKANRGSISNERDRELYKKLIGNIVGSCYISPNEQVIFTDQDYIYLFNTSNDTITPYKIPGADFRNGLIAEARVVNGCDRVVYFTDGVNPRRFFDFDNVNNFKTDGQYDLEKFNMTRAFTPPSIQTTILNSGGSLRYGVYNFVVQYLDENENVLYTSPVDINYTPITDSTNKGALNIDTNDVAAGAKPESGKSILLNVTNTGNAEFARITAIRTTTSDGFTSDAHVVAEVISITDGSFTYTYTGFSPERGDFTIDKSEVLVNNALYKTAVAQEQVQDRLLQANLTEQTLDYYGLQSYANDIEVKWVVRKESATNIRNRTRLGGDKKALGIVYVMSDGSYSPVQLIQPNSTPDQTTSTYELYITDDVAGRSVPFKITYQIGNSDPVIVWDETYDTGDTFVVQSQEEIKVLSFEAEESEVGFDIRSSSLQQTGATVDANPIPGFELSGNTGAYEVNQVYEQPVNGDCKDTQYWGALTGQNVQYHVLPDRSQIPLFADNQVYNIGFKFSNVNYPDGVIGHFFVESTVSDIETKGILTPFEDADTTNNRGSYFHYYDGERPRLSSKYANLLSPEFLYNQSYVSGNNIRVEGKWEYDFVNRDQTGALFSNSALPYDTLVVDIRKYTPTNYVQSAELDVNIRNSFILQKNSRLDSLENKSRTNPFNVLELTKDITFDTDRLIRYVTVYNQTGAFDNIYALRFRRITEMGQNISFAGDAFITPLELTNIVETNYETKFLISDEVYADAEILKKLYIESRVNTRLLHDGIDICDRHYPSSTSDDAEILDKLVDEDDQSLWFLKDPICPFWDGYNKDYSRISNFNNYAINSRTFNYCSTCQGAFPNRIIYSDRSFQERVQDNYRIFKANNYVDLPANKGSIQALDYKNGQLWVRTQYSCFVITPNPQQLALQGTTVEIGTGDFLSLQEQELNAVEIGYGGQLHPHESINTEHGLIWVDRSRGKVLMVTDTLSEISRTGMFQYFFDNLQVEDHIKLGYDPVHERLLLTNTSKEETISYCFENKMWKSFHSYLPDYYLYDKTTMYSVSGVDIYSHTSDDYLDSTLELILKDSHPFTVQSVAYDERHYSSTNEVLDQTFNEILVYNDKQCSGYKTILFNTDTNTPKIGYNPQEVQAVRKNNMHKVSPIRDVAIGTPVLDNQQNANVDFNLPQSQHKKFNDKWIGIRLVDKSKVKYVLDYIQTMKYFIEVHELNSKNQL